MSIIEKSVVICDACQIKEESLRTDGIPKEWASLYLSNRKIPLHLCADCIKKLELPEGAGSA